MNLETIITTLTDAGFIVDAVYPYVIVSLKNRPVNTMEVALVLNVEPSTLIRNGRTVQFPIGSTVKLSMYTGDDQIDRYYGQTLTVSEYREIKYFDIERYDGPPFAVRVEKSIPNYSLVAPDGIEITANEYELEAI